MTNDVERRWAHRKLRPEKEECQRNIEHDWIWKPIVAALDDGWTKWMAWCRKNVWDDEIPLDGVEKALDSLVEGGKENTCAWRHFHWSLEQYESYLSLFMERVMFPVPVPRTASCIHRIRWLPFAWPKSHPLLPQEVTLFKVQSISWTLDQLYESSSCPFCSQTWTDAMLIISNRCYYVISSDARVLYTVPHSMIHHISSSRTRLSLCAKDHARLTIRLSTPKDLEPLSHFLHRFLPSRGKEELLSYAMLHSDVSDCLLYDASLEYLRMNIPNDQFRLHYQPQYQICSTYPNVFVLPATFPVSKLRAAAQFRSKQRLPVCTYLYQQSVPLIRCAQPLVGLSRAQSSADEGLVNSYGEKMHLVDCRPRKNVWANTAKGAGVERLEGYSFLSVRYGQMENIHVIRKAHKEFILWLSAPNHVGPGRPVWLKHLSRLIQTAHAMVVWMEQGEGVCVHCSDGWDRTAQVCALAQVMLDAYYRTKEGFIVLIEKDWLSFGHQFAIRHGMHAHWHPSQQSPIFLQFLDAVYQLIQQFPDAFSFSDDFLLCLFHTAMSGTYSTFMGNCEKDRFHTMSKMSSAWPYCIQHSKNLSLQNMDVLHPRSRSKELSLWRLYFLPRHYVSSLN